MMTERREIKHKVYDEKTDRRKQIKLRRAAKEHEMNM